MFAACWLKEAILVQAFVAQVSAPPPRTLTSQIEQVRTFDALNRAKSILYGRSDDAPPWLTEAREIMGMDHSELKGQKEKATERGERMDAPFKEYIQRLDLFEERSSPVMADYVVVSNEDLSSLVFQAF